jgi:hypothetical protein
MSGPWARVANNIPVKAAANCSGLAARFPNALVLRGRHNCRNVGYARWHQSSLTTELYDCERGSSDKDGINQNFKSAPLFFL